MGNQSKKFDTQEILNQSSDQDVTPVLLQFGMKLWNGSGWVKAGTAGVGTSLGKSLTSASSAVQLASDTDCEYVDITVRAGIAAIGDSGANAEAANATGIIITPGSAPVRVYCTNLNQVYAAGATGTRICAQYW